MTTAVRTAPAGSRSSRERLIAMLCFAALLHGMILLGVSFTAGDGNSEGQGLEVLLVTDDLPEARRNDSATYLAQRTQRGAGTTTEQKAVRSPRSQQAEQARTVETSQNTDTPIHSVRSEQPTVQYLPSSLSVPESATGRASEQRDGSSGNDSGDADELVLRGSLNRDLMMAPDTRASELAPYLTALRQKVERIGTLNYPRSARQQDVTRSPVLKVTIDARGRLLRASITRSSGQSEVDQAALGILKLASPYDPLPPDLASHYNKLTISYAFEWQSVP